MLTIVGSALLIVTAAVFGSTLSDERVTTLPKSNGPATVGITIERPNGAPL